MTLRKKKRESSALEDATVAKTLRQEPVMRSRKGHEATVAEVKTGRGEN